MAPKVDVRIVLIVTISIISAIQVKYLNVKIIGSGRENFLIFFN